MVVCVCTGSVRTSITTFCGKASFPDPELTDDEVDLEGDEGFGLDE